MKMKTKFKQGTLTPHMKYLYKKAMAAFQVKSDKYILKDGRIVLISDFQVNGIVLVPDGDNLIPLAAGDHELKDGRRFTVGDGGIITVISKSKFYKVVKFTAAPKKNDFFGAKARRDESLKKLVDSLKNLKK